MVNLVVITIIILTTLSAVCGFIGVYILTSIGWSLVFISTFSFIIMTVLGYLYRNHA